MRKRRASPTEAVAALSDERVQRVAEHYRAKLTPSAGWKLSSKHNGKTRAVAVFDRLADGYTVEELCQAIDGVLLEPDRWHIEKGEIDLELIMRKVDKFLNMGRGASQTARPGNSRFTGPSRVSTAEEFAADAAAAAAGELKW